MKTTYSKKTSQISSTIRKFLSLTAAAAFVTVPLLGVVTTGEAAPNSHKSSKTTKKRDQRDKSRNQRSNRHPRDNRNQQYNSRNNRNQQYNSRNNRNNRVQVFQGPVTKIKGQRDFDIRANGRTYNVTASNSFPRNLRRNDQVRVQGVRSGNNDIVNARVTIVRRY